MEERAWQFHEVLQQLLQARNFTIEDQCLHQEGDVEALTHFRQEGVISISPESTLSSSLSGPEGAPCGPPQELFSATSNRAYVRRHLKQLNFLLEEILEELTRTQQNHRVDSEDILAALRADMFDLLTDINLHGLVVIQEDQTLHEIYNIICQKARDYLVNYDVLDSDLLTTDEVTKILNSLLWIWARGGPNANCPSDLVHNCILFDFLNKSLCAVYAMARAESNEETTWNGNSFLEYAIGGRIQTLGILKEFLPPAQWSLESKTSSSESDDDTPSLLEDLKDSLLTFTHLILENVRQTMKLRGFSVLYDYLREEEAAAADHPPSREEGGGVANQSEATITLANEVFELIQSYASALIESTFDGLDTTTFQCAAMSTTQQECHDSENNAVAAVKEEISDIMLQMSKKMKFAHAALRLVLMEQSEDRIHAHHESSGKESTTNKKKTNNNFKSSVKSLWISYAKFFCSALGQPFETFVCSALGQPFQASEGAIVFATEAFIKVAILALSATIKGGTSNHRDQQQQEEEQEPAQRNLSLVLLDDEEEHALSITLMAALEFPELLLHVQDGKLLDVIRVGSKNNSELRHLVQGVSLRGLVLPTRGAARQPVAMDEVLRALIQIGSSGASTSTGEGDEDPWDCFFRDQIAMLSELKSQEDESCEVRM